MVIKPSKLWTDLQPNPACKVKRELLEFFVHSCRYHYFDILFKSATFWIFWELKNHLILKQIEFKPEASWFSIWTALTRTLVFSSSKALFFSTSLILSDRRISMAWRSRVGLAISEGALVVLGTPLSLTTSTSASSDALVARGASGGSSSSCSSGVSSSLACSLAMCWLT